MNFMKRLDPRRPMDPVILSIQGILLGVLVLSQTWWIVELSRDYDRDVPGGTQSFAWPIMAGVSAFGVVYVICALFYSMLHYERLDEAEREAEEVSDALFAEVIR